MTDHEIEELKLEVLAAHKDKINDYNKDNKPLDCISSDSSIFSDISDFLPICSIRGISILIARLFSKPQVVCLVLITTMTFEALHLHPIIGPTRQQMIVEYSDYGTWSQKVANNSDMALVNHFVESPMIPPHVPEEPPQEAPRSTTYIPITGFSPAISGQYYQ